MLRSIFSLVNISEMEVGFLSALSKKKNKKNVYLKLNENQGSFGDGLEIHESGFCSCVCFCLVDLSSMDAFSLPQNKELHHWGSAAVWWGATDMDYSKRWVNSDISSQVYFLMLNA